MQKQMDEPRIERAGHGYYLDGRPAELYTSEDVEDANRVERQANSDAMGAVEQAGFVKYPLFTWNVNGENIEKEAWIHPDFEPSVSVGFEERHEMKFNIYIPSYQRAGTAGTMKMLDEFGIKNYYICIDATQFQTYRQAYPEHRLVIRDTSFRDPDMLYTVSAARHPMTMAGTAPLYNFILALSRSMGETHFWTHDDDILGMAVKALRADRVSERTEDYASRNFHRVSTVHPRHDFDLKTFMADIEDIVVKTRNPGFAGLEKFGMTFTDPTMVRLGTRVFSYYLSRVETQIAHYGRQNNDIVTSLEFEKRGLVNMLFKGLGYNSVPTQGGGGQTDLYEKWGTLDKTRVVVRAHPARATVIDKYSRIHHNTDFNDLPKRVVGLPMEEDETEL